MSRLIHTPSETYRRDELLETSRVTFGGWGREGDREFDSKVRKIEERKCWIYLELHTFRAGGERERERYRDFDLM